MTTATLHRPHNLSNTGAPRPRTAFVLSGGASLGALQVGMLEALYERGIAPDFLVGNSVGALNAAFVRIAAPVLADSEGAGPSVARPAAAGRLSRQLERARRRCVRPAPLGGRGS